MAPSPLKFPRELTSEPVPQPALQGEESRSNTQEVRLHQEGDTLLPPQRGQIQQEVQQEGQQQIQQEKVQQEEVQQEGQQQIQQEKVQ